MENKINALAALIGCDAEDIECESYDSYGLCVFTVQGEEWAVGIEEEAQAACQEAIKQSLWAFRPEFILSHCKAGVKPALVKALKQVQEKLCENANEFVEVLIKDLDDFIEDAISSDGRGSFLSPYDNEEQEIKVNDTYYYAYRLN